MRFIILTVLAACLQAETMQFEVASLKVRPADSLIIMIGGAPSGSRLRMEAMSLSDLIAWAYNVKPWQVAGGPRWAGIQFDRTTLDPDTKHFDLNAKAEGDGERPRGEFQQMVQTLLAERFHLAIHRERRETDVYALVVDKKGSKLRPSAPTAPGILRMNAGGRIIGSGATIVQLAGWFSKANGVERPIMDQTGLNGHYDFTLEWTLDGSGPSIFTALPEQLGLRLEAKREPIEVLVIDQAELPEEE